MFIMTDHLPKKLKEQAILYILDEMDKIQRNRFEAEVKQNILLQNYMDEINSTLTLTQPITDIKPSQISLQGQRNILRGRIAQINDQETSSPSFVENIHTIITSIGRFRQPVWAVVTYVVIAFFAGSVYFSPTQNSSDNTTSLSYPSTIQELIQSGAINTADINIGQDNSPIQFALQSSSEVNISGTVEDELVRNLLFYLLLHDRNPGNRLKAIRLMEGIEPVNEAMMVMISSALSDPNPGIRLKSTQLLQQFAPNPTLIDACQKILLEETNEAIRMEALSILSSAPSPEIASTLHVISLMDENDHIREQATRVLAEMKEMYPPQRIESTQ